MEGNGALKAPVRDNNHILSCSFVIVHKVQMGAARATNFEGYIHKGDEMNLIRLSGELSVPAPIPILSMDNVIKICLLQSGKAGLFF